VSADVKIGAVKQRSGLHQSCVRTDLSTVRQLAQKTRIEMNFSEYNGETGGIYKSKVDVASDASACTLP
jgi:hypothetical protein